MTAYALTPMAAAALQDIANNGGSASILLSRPAASIHAAVCIEQAGAQMEAVVIIGNTTNSLTLQTRDSANARHLAEFVEAIANGTLDTAAAPAETVAAGHTLLPCWKCKGAAIGFDYCAPGPGTRFLHGAKCRHNDCQTIMDCASEAAAADCWNAIQAGSVDDNHSGEDADMVNHPPHYSGHPSGVECIQVTERLSFNLGNAFKYVFRHRAKNGHEDLLKAQWYLTRELERSDLVGISIGDLDANTLASRIAAHECYPVGACLVAIANYEPQEAMRWLSKLIDG
ncbi:DUF3310 domain-containing protein [Pseudomonas panipatensis]|uniref:Protein of unknwon function n=1 Tax=Pseudomonas panipatensis TaxID=428992 RepID=A0A1G8CU11_9PSED|nr:DUF3310 domain-containing protein [Pseudomonas panipatensis]SDH48975.1 Protein of unknwon function [Pseudomonas panipatensis]SMP63483.1 Protein of unknwon function [Pseudomonas panipatensis]